MRKLKLGLASLAAVAVLAGCSSATAFTDVSEQVATRSTATGDSGSSEALNTLLPENQESHYSQEDSDYDESSVTQITLNGSSATASGGGVTVDGSTVTITSAGTYRLAGSLAGQVVVNADRGYVLIENGTINVTSGDDGIKGFNDVAISGGAVTVSNSLEVFEAQTLVISGARPG